MIVVDSSVWIGKFRDDPVSKSKLSLLKTSNLLVGDVVLLEILRGARSDQHARTLQRLLAPFQHVRMLDEETAVEAAANYRLLRAKGITVRSTPDLIIATFCIRNGHRLIQQDRDFQPMAEHLGLRLA